jgi:hypothetical protein
VFFKIGKYFESYIVLRYLTQEEVNQKLGEEGTDVIAMNLVKQLSKILPRNQTVKLIQHYG